MRRPFFIVLFAAWAAACGETSGDDGLTPPPGSRDGGVSPDGSTVGFSSPLLEQPSTDAYACQPSRPADKQAELWTGFAFAGGPQPPVWMVRIAATRPDPFAPPDSYRLQMLPVNADGSLGAATDLVAPTSEVREEVSVASMGANVLIAWFEDGTIRSMVVDASGTVVSGPHVLGTATDFLNTVQVVAGANGSLVLWSSTVGRTGRNSVQVQALDATGAPSGSPLLLLDSSVSFAQLTPEVVADGDAYAMTYVLPTDEADEVRFQRLSASGALDGDPVLLASVDRTYLGFAGSRVALLALESGFVAAWSEAGGGGPDYDDPAWTSIRIARLDAEGRPIGAPALVQAQETHFDHEEPELFWFGDQIALTWGRGDHIYVCAGCVPNHDTKLVLIDPVKLVPSSNVATLEADATGGGLLHRAHGVIGGTIVQASRVVFHVHHEVATGAFSCAAR